MRKQQQIWQDEHIKSTALPSVADAEPSRSGIYFFEFLKNHELVPHSRFVDIGSGKGRNAVYFAQQSFKCFAMEYIPEAIAKAKALAEAKGVAKFIDFSENAIDSTWPFQDNFFDAALDSYSSIDIETSEGRVVYKSEMLRTLKPGGFAMVCVVSADDEFEKDAAKPSGAGKKFRNLAKRKISKRLRRTGVKRFLQRI